MFQSFIYSTAGMGKADEDFTETWRVAKNALMSAYWATSVKPEAEQ